MYDLAIIGGGPAGLSAGIYASRGGLNTVIIESMSVGGQASTAHNIENYPGIKSSSGFDLCYTMLEQAKSFGCEFIFDIIEHISLHEDVKTMITMAGRVIEAKNVIIASGASARPLGVENEGTMIGRGLSYCATCDGGFFRGKTVAVVGGGNTAVEDALYLEKLAKKVYLVHRRNELRADKILQERIKKSSVQIIWDRVVEEVQLDEVVTGLTLKDVKNNTLSSLLVDGVFVAIGQDPSSKLFEGVNKDDKGYILTDENMRTNIKGVFAAGDIRAKSLRQVVTACSDGAIAADTVIKEMS